MIKQFPEDVGCYSLSFHGDNVFIGSYGCVILWNVVTDAVERLGGYPPRLIYFTFALLGFKLLLDFVYALDVSSDGSVVVGGSYKFVIAHETDTGAMLWRKVMTGKVWSLRIHGGVVIVPVENSNTVVLDVTTGQQLHTLPSAGEGVSGICVFDGLTKITCFLFN